MPLFLSDDPAFQQRVVQGMTAAMGVSEEEARKRVLLGSVDDIKQQVPGFIDAGVQEFMLAQWPRIHTDSLRRFSSEVIPEFK